MDEELETRSRDQLLGEARNWRVGIGKYRDSTGQDISWCQPKLWRLQQEPSTANIAAPEWPKFMRCCARDRECLDQ